MSEDKNMTILNRVRDKIGNGLNRALVTLAFIGCVNALSAKTVVGRVLELDGTTTYLQTGKEIMKIESGSLVRAITATNQKRGEVGLVKLDIDDNTSEVRGGLVYSTGFRVTSGISDLVYDVGSWTDDAEKLKDDVRAGNVRGVIGDMVDRAVNILPEQVVGEQGSCAYVIGYRYKDGKRQKGWMPANKRGADGDYMENGKTKTVRANQLKNASEKRNNGSNDTQTRTSKRNYTQTSSYYGSSRYD